MTEQARQIFAARLERIWGSIEPVWSETNTGGALTFFGYVASCQLEFAFLPPDTVHVHLMDFERNASMNYYVSGGTTEMDNALSSSTPESWERDHLHLFRRGCWLSGLPIEATAHEKAEWMQGFTQAELQAWNLNL